MFLVKMRIRILSCTLKMLPPDDKLTPSRALDFPRYERSDSSNSSQEPTNSSTSTFTPNRPPMKPLSRDAHFVWGPMRPEKHSFAKSGTPSSFCKGGDPMPIIEPT